MSPDSGFSVISRSTAFAGKLLTVENVELLAPDGESVMREVVAHPGSVAVLPLDGDDVVLIRQYRAPVGGPVLEIPAGLLDVAGEDPEAAAARECEEEIGYRPDHMQVLGSFLISPGFTNERTTLYLASGLSKVAARPHAAEERAATVVRMPLAEAIAMVPRGQIVDAKTIVALLWVASER